MFEEEENEEEEEDEEEEKRRGRVRNWVHDSRKFEEMRRGKEAFDSVEWNEISLEESSEDVRSSCLSRLMASLLGLNCSNANNNNRPQTWTRLLGSNNDSNLSPKSSRLNASARAQRSSRSQTPSCEDVHETEMMMMMVEAS